MMLMLIISLRWDDVDVNNVIDMWWCWCWEWHWDEMILILKMTLRWDVVDVENVIWWCMLCMYMSGALTMMNILGGGNRVVKEF